MTAVSVVIPLYNKRGTIRRAIASALAQGIDGIEVIVVDDGSTDDSAAIVRAISDPRVRLVGQANAGPGIARNNGAAVARGRFLAFLDADDEWRGDFLRAGLDALAAEPGARVYVCGFDAGDFRAQRPNKIRSSGLGGVMSLQPDVSGDAAKAMVDALHSSCVLIDRDAFLARGGYYDRERCLFGEDSWLWLQILFHERIIFDPEERCLFHVEDSNLGFAVSRRDRARPISLFGGDLAAHCAPELRPALARVIRTYQQIDLQTLIFSGSFGEAWRLRVLMNDGGLLPRLGDLGRYAVWNLRRAQR